MKNLKQLLKNGYRITDVFPPSYNDSSWEEYIIGKYIPHKENCIIINLEKEIAPFTIKQKIIQIDFNKFFSIDDITERKCIRCIIGNLGRCIFCKF